jgi:hypothetical protein
MRSGQHQKPPYDFPGPAGLPTSDSFSNLASDPDLQIRAFVAGSLATQAGYEQAKPKSPKDPNYRWIILAVLYVAILALALVIYSSPESTTDLKNQSLGFMFGQATLILSFIFKNKDKD